MKPTYSAVELTAFAIPGLPTTPRGFQGRAKKEKWPHLNETVKGGYEKRYLYLLLPENIRVAIAARENAKPTPQTTGEGAAAGSNLATQLLVEAAQGRERAQIIKERGLAAYNMLPEAKKKIADARFEILRARDAFVTTASLPMKRGSELFCLHYKDGSLRISPEVRELLGPSLSWSTLNRWQQAYSLHGMVGLSQGYKAANKSATSLTPSQRRLAQAMVAHNTDISITKIMQALEARADGQSVPHVSSVRRYVNRYKKENAVLLLHNSNPDACKNKYQVAFGQADEQVERLNQIWEFDSTPTDVMLADGRHSIIGVLDVFSRRAKMLVSPTSKAAAVAALTRRSLLDWGVPEIAKTDNGADYVSNHMVRIFTDLEIEQILCPPFTPEKKPHIERFFKTFSHDIVELLPGYIGHNVTERKAIEARRSFAERLMKKEGEALDLSRYTAAQLQEICDRWCLAIYEQNPHGGLHHQKPAEVARAWQQPVRKISDVRALDILLCPAAGGNGQRLIRKKGIKVDGVNFINPEIAAHVGEEVFVLLDATDYGTIHVFLLNYHGDKNFLCTAVDPLRTGHNRAEIAATGRAIYNKVMNQGRKELKKLAREEAVDGIHQEILTHRESQIANIVPLPQRSEEYTTRSLAEAAKAVTDQQSQNRQQQEMDELLEEITQERLKESSQIEQKKKAGIVPIFGTMTERYQYIRDRAPLKGISALEVEFLTEFYCTKQGATFLELEGDLRRKYETKEAAMAAGGNAQPAKI